MRSTRSSSFSLSARLEAALIRFCEDQDVGRSVAIQEAITQYLGKRGYWALGPRCPKCASEHLNRHDWLLECRECGFCHDIVPPEKGENEKG